MKCKPSPGLQGRTALMLTVIAILLAITAAPATAQTESVLLKFNGVTDGAGSQGGLVADSAGNLYGTTIVGGSGYGTIFELSPPTAGGAWTESVLTALPILRTASIPRARWFLISLGICMARRYTAAAPRLKPTEWFSSFRHPRLQVGLGRKRFYTASWAPPTVRILTEGW